MVGMRKILSNDQPLISAYFYEKIKRRGDKLNVNLHSCSRYLKNIIDQRLYS